MSRSWKTYITVIIVGMSVFALFRRYSVQVSLSPSSRFMSSLTLPLNDGNTIPWLAFGTGTALYGKDSDKSVQQAIEAGIVHLDGAQSYGNEDTLGAGVVASGKPRASLFITTKLAALPAGKSVRDTLLLSLKKLQTDYVDLFLIHSPVEQKDLKSVWKQFEELQKEGLAKSIGVSNFRVQDFEVIADGATVVPAVNQIEYHPYLFKASKPVVEYAKKHNILLTSFGGLGPITRWKGGPLDPVLATIRARVEKTAGQPVTEVQVLQLWLRAKKIPAITTSTKLERVKEYLATVTLPGLTDEEVLAIDDAGSKAHHRAFQNWLD
ncbi:Aldo/keto reductase [Amylocystis lapponica]|nr:Aldo/keto reductase [Amylocystis lapponica]